MSFQNKSISINGVNLSDSFIIHSLISLSTTLLRVLSLLTSAWAVFALSLSILSTSAFKLAKFYFAAKLDVSTSVAPLKSAFVA